MQRQQKERQPLFSMRGFCGAKPCAQPGASAAHFSRPRAQYCSVVATCMLRVPSLQRAGCRHGQYTAGAAQGARCTRGEVLHTPSSHQDLVNDKFPGSFWSSFVLSSFSSSSFSSSSSRRSSSFWQATHTQAHTLITTGVCVNFVYTVRGPTPTMEPNLTESRLLAFSACG